LAPGGLPLQFESAAMAYGCRGKFEGGRAVVGFPKASIGATLLVAVMAGAPARAAIKCQDGSQLIQGNWMATPYCQDKLLAEVALSRGFKTTFAEIRNNPNHKKELCRFLYTDIRVQMTCLDAGVPEYFGGGAR